ncbi:MAG: PQQ-binding-like beta-propeller repeat protein [Acidimicrobiales bacterium]|nr:PQQ-binding-like beta-propeller repeat protein [Acidimicrobiales bacterium]
MLVTTACGSGTSPSASAAGTTPTTAASPGPWDWPTYGHDAQHSFDGRTTLTPASARKLKVAWYFHTGDVVTATPTVVGGTVYVGSWDDVFYALDLATGAVRWTFHLSPQDAVTPYPGQVPRDGGSDGGLVTSSAWYEPASGPRPALVIFGGGYTLYALDAETGALYWRHDYPGRQGTPPDPNTDGTRIFSSPVVADGLVLFGVDVDGQHDSAGYVVGANLQTGAPVWEFQTDADGSGQVLDDGCGSVWASGTVLARLGLVVFDTADCHFGTPAPFAGTVLALHIATGRMAWTFQPEHADASCDWDFGAWANAGNDFLGVGGKDGTYYSLDPATGRERWATNVVFGGFSGGFIATTAYDGKRVYGSTSLGDYGHFEKDTQVLCDPGDPRDTTTQEPSVHAFVADSGAIAWQDDHAPSFAPTTVAGGMTFNGPAVSGPFLFVRAAATGALITRVGLPGLSWSGVATVGDALVTGIGSSAVAQPAGVVALTPGGVHPTVPASG